MQLVHLRENFEKLVRERGLQVQLGAPATELAVDAFEKRIGQSAPIQVRQFYRTVNGLSVVTPALKLPCIEDLTSEDGKVRFASFADDVAVGFDIRTVNVAGQWEIVNLLTGYVITHTMASFWSNKIWAWVLNRREIWGEEKFK